MFILWIILLILVIFMEPTPYREVQRRFGMVNPDVYLVCYYAVWLVLMYLSIYLILH